MARNKNRFKKRKAQDRKIAGREIQQLKTQPLEDVNDVPIAVTFCNIANGFCVDDCGKNEKVKFIKRLRIMGNMSWKQLDETPRQSGGTEKIDYDSINVGIPNCISPDTTIFSIRFSGQGIERIIGFRERRIFHIVWVDVKGKVYNH